MNIASPGETRKVIGAYRPDAVIHCAVYTNVDGAEGDPLRAYTVNATGTQNIAACLEVGAKMVYISTDYVFDGLKGEAYREFDVPTPLNVYGWSKRRGRCSPARRSTGCSSPARPGCSARGRISCGRC